MSFLMIILFFCSIHLSANEIVNCSINPYENVNWSVWEQYKANFHTHTILSGGTFTPAEVIDNYYIKDYRILSITDHNLITWPWADYGRDPDSLGMLAVKGDEYSNSLHVNAFFNFSRDTATMEEGIPHIDSLAGLSHINHPGRTKTPEEWPWYIPWYQNYQSCVGLEVFNKGDLYPNDRKLWDNINENLFNSDSMFVWGFSNDDMHTEGNLYHNFQFMLMPSLSQENLKTCMDEGAFYFCYEITGSGAANVPRINSIDVDDEAKTISIEAADYDSIKWIGPGTIVFGSGEVFQYSDYFNKNFIRAVLYGPEGSTYSQPFGFKTVSTTISPAIPSNINTVVSGDSMIISWDISENAESYDIYSSNDPEGIFTFEANVIENQFIVTVSEAKKFYYIIGKNDTKSK